MKTFKVLLKKSSRSSEEDLRRSEHANDTKRSLRKDHNSHVSSRSSDTRKDRDHVVSHRRTKTVPKVEHRSRGASVGSTEKLGNSSKGGGKVNPGAGERRLTDIYKRASNLGAGGRKLHEIYKPRQPIDRRLENIGASPANLNHTSPPRRLNGESQNRGVETKSLGQLPTSKCLKYVNTPAQETSQDKASRTQSLPVPVPKAPKERQTTPINGPLKIPDKKNMKWKRMDNITEADESRRTPSPAIKYVLSTQELLMSKAASVRKIINGNRTRPAARHPGLWRSWDKSKPVLGELIEESESNCGSEMTDSIYSEMMPTQEHLARQNRAPS